MEKHLVMISNYWVGGADCKDIRSSVCQAIHPSVAIVNHNLKRMQILP